MHEFWVYFREDSRLGKPGLMYVLDRITPVRFGVGVWIGEHGSVRVPISWSFNYLF